MKWFGPCAICLSSAERTNLEKGILLQICKAYLHQSAFTHKHITCAKNSKEKQKQNISWSRRRSLGQAWRCLKNDCGSVHAAQLEISSAKLQKNGRCGGTPTSGQLKPLRVATLGAAATHFYPVAVFTCERLFEFNTRFCVFEFANAPAHAAEAHPFI